MPTSKSGAKDKVTYQMLSEDFWTVRRMVTRASLVPTWRASSLTGLSRDCPAKAVEAHAVAAAIAADRNTIWGGERWREAGSKSVTKRRRVCYLYLGFGCTQSPDRQRFWHSIGWSQIFWIVGKRPAHPQLTGSSPRI